MQMELRDEILVERARRGDAAAFGALLTRHYDSMFRIGYRVLGVREDAEDLAQEICASLPRKLQSFRGEARFSTWLHSLTVNGARDMIRRKQATRRKAAGWGDVELLRKAEATEQRREQEWLTDAMQLLSADLRETVALVLGEEMTHKQAGEVLGLSEGTVSWRMGEVRKVLRDLAGKEAMGE